MVGDRTGMKIVRIEAVQAYMLKRVLYCILALLILSFMILLLANPPESTRRTAYTHLILTLLLMTGAGIVLEHRGFYNLSAAITVAMTVFGPWGSLLIDPLVFGGDFFPLVYVVIPVMVSSLFLPLPATIVLAIAQFVTLVLVVAGSPVFGEVNCPSLLAFVIISCTLSMFANYLLRHQLFALRESAIRDHLTGLFNRRYLDATLDLEIERAKVKEVPLGVVVLDIDNFKACNDRFGHSVGDEVLRTLGRHFLSQLDLEDTVCRYGGDEFSMIMPGKTVAEAFASVQSLNKTVAALEVMVDGRSLGRISISLGLAMFPEHGLTRKELIEHADYALLAAKVAGKNRAQVYVPPPA